MRKRKIKTLLRRINRELSKSDALLPGKVRHTLENVKSTLESILESEEPDIRPMNRERLINLITKLIPIMLDERIWKNVRDLF